MWRGREGPSGPAAAKGSTAGPRQAQPPTPTPRGTEARRHRAESNQGASGLLPTLRARLGQRTQAASAFTRARGLCAQRPPANNCCAPGFPARLHHLWQRPARQLVEDHPEEEPRTHPGTRCCRSAIQNGPDPGGHVGAASLRPLSPWPPLTGQRGDLHARTWASRVGLLPSHSRCRLTRSQGTDGRRPEWGPKQARDALARRGLTPHLQGSTQRTGLALEA